MGRLELEWVIGSANGTFIGSVALVKSLRAERGVFGDDVEEEFFAVGVFDTKPMVFGGDFYCFYKIGLNEKVSRVADQRFVDAYPQLPVGCRHSEALQQGGPSYQFHRWLGNYDQGTPCDRLTIMPAAKRVFH